MAGIRDVIKRLKKGSAAERAKVSDADDEWFFWHREDLVTIGRREYVSRGRGLIVVDAADRFKPSEFDYQYWTAEEFISRNPAGIVTKHPEYADMLRAYDPDVEVLCVLTDNESTFRAGVLLRSEPIE